MSQLEVRALSAPERRRQRGIYTMFALAVGAIIAFGLIPSQNERVTFGFVMDKEWVAFHEISLNSKSGSLIFATLALLTAAVAYLQFRARKPFAWPAEFLALHS
jgi:hypothetical protein